MTIREALYRLTNGYAARRPSWKGYVKRVDTVVDGVVTSYALTFVFADGTETTYTMGTDSAADKVTKDGTTVKKGTSAATAYTHFVPITHFMLEAILASDWEIVLTENAATAAAGENEM